ncbi:DotD/TraH family lipoprotein [Defluviimonas salinarum]|uniref:DotD/TraH family lipoprotein n=1 Tax=Defluviimonas salinarum TaxID=2992147 RepID=A0ABT3J5A9_9RHOB|nr:DotD/TraH family lipoprotein [Defluviimonas salinarum]MCW3782589.1 DotD/TraH family lipoprotein [Defluviimonas salinarum]
MRKTTASVLVMAAIVSACGSMTEKTAEVPPIEAIDSRIAEAVETSANANRAIAEVEVATAAPVRQGPGQAVPPNVVLPPEAIQPVTADWQGPVEPFLEEMATRAGYSFSVTGRKPANPMMITITANEEPLFGVVRRAGAMAHGYADIGFNPSARTIEIRYGG